MFVPQDGSLLAVLAIGALSIAVLGVCPFEVVF